MQPLLMQLRALFAEAEFPWALCGGYALEVFAGGGKSVPTGISTCACRRRRAQTSSRTCWTGAGASMNTAGWGRSGRSGALLTANPGAT